MKTIMGILKAASGAIAFEKRNLLAIHTHERARLGIGYMPEDRRLIPDLTVEENILVPAWSTKTPGRASGWKRSMPSFRRHANSPAQGPRALRRSAEACALARALMSARGSCFSTSLRRRGAGARAAARAGDRRSAARRHGGDDDRVGPAAFGKARRPRDRHRPRCHQSGALMLRSDVLVVGSGAAACTPPLPQRAQAATCSSSIAA